MQGPRQPALFPRKTCCGKSRESGPGYKRPAFRFSHRRHVCSHLEEGARKDVFVHSLRLRVERNRAPFEKQVLPVRERSRPFLPSAPADFNIHSAKTRLSRLIARYGQPVWKDRIPGTAMDKRERRETGLRSTMDHGSKARAISPRDAGHREWRYASVKGDSTRQSRFPAA